MEFFEKTSPDRSRSLENVQNVIRDMTENGWLALEHVMDVVKMSITKEPEGEPTSNEESEK